ncbi:hypothetical protein KJ657_00290 [Patescibacteria group bacterium]|nr:hypothetical protein [Patescibacteria group bacterium]MBU1015516.1 hypothetical protein [Patescibacteria group bacterium]MBU1685634.1 hypothetical protein [Patescibacteria group bacterium]MBU1938127.1 hypothetical protein [Patescibacteria group bacterium]
MCKNPSESNNVIDLADYRRRHAEKAGLRRSSQQAISDTRRKVTAATAVTCSYPESELETWWDKISSLRQRIKEIESMTSDFSQADLEGNMNLASGYSNEEILDFVSNSTTEDWQADPTFYRAVIAIADRRFLE